MARIAAEENAAEQVTLAETAKMEARDAAVAVEQANAALIVAQDMQKAAEDERDDAIDARDEAQRQLGLAQAARTDEERRREEAEAERERAEQEAEDARAIANRAQAKNAFDGLDLFVDGTAAGIIGTDDPAVTPRYRASAGVTGTTGVTFVNPTTGSQGRWFRTSYSNTGGLYVDRMDVYSDAEQPERVDFKDSTYNDVNPPIVNAEGDVVGAVSIAANMVQEHTASSAFPRTSGVPDGKDLVHRGMNMAQFESARGAIETDHDDLDDGFTAADRNTQEFRDALEDAGITRSQYNQYFNDTFRNEAIYPFRYTYSTSGTLQGASGTYRCGGDTADVDCSVQNRGDHFNFVGTWTFRPSSGTTDVLIDDSEFMYFGWWSRQAIATEDWSFRVFHGPTASQVSDVAAVSGTATYQGPAVGQYAIYQPLGTEVGARRFQRHGDTDRRLRLRS